MAPNMTTTPRLGIPIPTDTPTPNIISDFIPIMNLVFGATGVDSKLLGYLQGTLAARPAFGVSNRMYYATDTLAFFMDTGTAWVQLGGSRVQNREHSWTLDDATALNSSAVKMASFPVYPAPSETVALIGAVILCDSQGAVASTFKIQTDHAAHGTYADVAGLTSLTPGTGAYVYVAASSSVPLVTADGVRIVATNPGTGTSKGIEVAPVTQHTV